MSTELKVGDRVVVEGVIRETNNTGRFGVEIADSGKTMAWVSCGSVMPVSVVQSVPPPGPLSQRAQELLLRSDRPQSYRPEQPPVDNAHVAEGAEKFSEPGDPAAGTDLSKSGASAPEKPEPEHKPAAHAPAKEHAKPRSAHAATKKKK